MLAGQPMVQAVAAASPNDLIRRVKEYVRRPQQAWAADLFVVVEPSEHGRTIRGKIYIGQDFVNSFTAASVDSFS